MAQMFLHRLSKLLVVCWMESHSVSLAHASESCSRTSQILKTDSTPAVCCSMSRCRSCHWQNNSFSRRKHVRLDFRHTFSKCCRGWGKSNLCVRKSLFSFRKQTCRMSRAEDRLTGQDRTATQKGIVQLWYLSESSIFSLTVWTVLMCIQNPNLTHTKPYTYTTVFTLP